MVGPDTAIRASGHARSVVCAALVDAYELFRATTTPRASHARRE